MSDREIYIIIISTRLTHFDAALNTVVLLSSGLLLPLRQFHVNVGKRPYLESKCLSRKDTLDERSKHSPIHK